MEEYYYYNILGWNPPASDFQRRVWEALDSIGEIEDPETDPGDIGGSCEKLYVHSLRTKKRLPPELHEKMLLWSYSEEGKMYVRLYLLWVEKCDELEENRKRHEKFEKIQDATIVLMIGTCAAMMFFVLVL